MGSISSSVSQDDKEKWFDRFLRFGLISKGIVYCLLGILAFMTAAGLSQDEASKKETFVVIYDQPFGQVLLLLLSIGMLGYVTLRSYQCFKDSDNKGDSMKGLIIRIGYGFSALMYLGLTAFALNLVFNGSDDDGSSRKFFVGKILSLSYGEWLIGIAGLIIVGSGINQIYKGLSASFMKQITLIRSSFEKLYKNAGRIGYTSRGIVLGIIGYLILHAAFTSNPGEAEGSEQAFAFIENKFGSFLMGSIALGLIAYGVFMFVKARYQKLNIDLD
jgi:hypothetical protein